MKKFLSFVLAISMIASIVALLPVFATEDRATPDFSDGTWTPITDVSGFIGMANTGKYYLASDIDFGGTEYQGVVWGGSAFAGTLDGNGKSLLNIKINGTETGVASIFGADFHGTIMNLTFGSEKSPIYVRSSMDNSQINTQIYTVVATTITGGDTATFENVNVYADVKFEGATAAAFGRVAAFAGDVTGIKVDFTNCHVYGKLDGRPVAGFVLGTYASTPEITFTNCTNNAEILCSYKREDSTAGFYGATWIGKKTATPHKLTFVNCQNNGNISSYKGSLASNVSAGGFICSPSNIAFDVTFDGCTNNGTVYADHGCSSGFFSIRNNGNASAASNVVIRNSINNGNISGRTNTGNVSAGFVAVPTDVEGSFTIENCVNNGDITGGTRGAGGIFTVNTYRGSYTGAFKSRSVSIIGCVNTGTISGQDYRAGGIVGQVSGVNNSSNTATTAIVIQYCMNLGKVNAFNKVGNVAAGICGEINMDTDASDIVTVTNNYTVGTIEHAIKSGFVYAICKADQAESKGVDSLTVSNNVWLDGTVICKDADGNAVAGTAVNTANIEDNNFKVTSAAELLAKLNEVKIADSPVQFVADTKNENNGYPVLSWSKLPGDTTPDDETPDVEEAPLEEEWTAVATPEDFVNMKPNGKYYLTAHIDFSGAQYNSVVWTGSGFYGILDGRGFSLLNLKIEGGTKGVASIFGDNFHGTIENLTFGSASSPIYVRGTLDNALINTQIYTVVATTIAGDETVFENVTVYADVKFEGKTDGAFGRVAAFAGNVTGKVDFTNCHVYGKLDGRPVAGFVTATQDASPEITFTNCTNNAEILCSYAREDSVAGFYASTWIGNKSEAPHKLTFENCVNNGNITSTKTKTSYVSAGGFICAPSHLVFDVTVENCVNNGAVYANHGCAGGFIGIRNNGNALAASSIVIKNSLNNGRISGKVDTGNASAGFVAVPTDFEGSIAIESCENHGDVTGGTRSAAGIFTVNTYRGDYTGAYKSRTVSIIGCKNTGDITSSNHNASGIVGSAAAGGVANTVIIQNCINTGTIKAEVEEHPENIAVGILGEAKLNDGAVTVTVTGNQSLGKLVTSTNSGSTYAIAYSAVAPSSKDSVTIENNTYIYGTALNNKLTDTNNKKIFCQATIENNVISTDDIAGFVTTRKGSAANTTDIRFILAVDVASALENDTVDIIITFYNGNTAVDTKKLDFSKLTVFDTVTADGVRYTSADGDAFFGIVFKDVDNESWTSISLTVDASRNGSMTSSVTNSILPQ